MRELESAEEGKCREGLRFVEQKFEILLDLEL